MLHFMCGADLRRNRIYHCRNVSVFVPAESDLTAALCEKAGTTMLSQL